MMHGCDRRCYQGMASLVQGQPDARATLRRGKCRVRREPRSGALVMKPLASLSLAAGALLSACHSVTEPPKPTMALYGGAPAPTVTKTDIGPLGPGVPGQCLFPLSKAIDVNDRGLVVGWGQSREGDESLCTVHGFIWDNGTLTNLGAIAPVAVT